MTRTHRFAIALLLVAASWGLVQAAMPPMLVNYQGVLKSVSGAALPPQANMILRLYDAPAPGGNLLYEDQHTTFNGGPVTVAASGAFNVAIGSGFRLPGLTDNLREVFRNRDEVYLSVQVESDVLDPRTRILSAPYALSNPRGVTYTRWGRTTCPNGVETIYDGIAGGEESAHPGGTSSQLCLSKVPSYPTPTNNIDDTGADIYGTEYEGNNSALTNLLALRYKTATCAVCFQPDADVVFTYPGTTSCPGGWHQEYGGYLMSTASGLESKEAICVDEAPQAVSGSNPADDLSNSLYPVEANGLILSGQGYLPFREIGCVVCSR